MTGSGAGEADRNPAGALGAHRAVLSRCPTWRRWLAGRALGRQQVQLAGTGHRCATGGALTALACSASPSRQRAPKEQLGSPCDR